MCRYSYAFFFAQLFVNYEWFCNFSSVFSLVLSFYISLVLSFLQFHVIFRHLVTIHGRCYPATAIFTGIKTIETLSINWWKQSIKIQIKSIFVVWSLRSSIDRSECRIRNSSIHNFGVITNSISIIRFFFHSFSSAFIFDQMSTHVFL